MLRKIVYTPICDHVVVAQSGELYRETVGKLYNRHFYRL